MISIPELELLPAPELLRRVIETYGEKFAVVSSFQAEGMAILDMAARVSPGIRVVTVDTGRLPEETYEMIETVRTRYGVRVEVVFPDPAEVQGMVHRHGPNLFYSSEDLRMLCCNVRKVRPLERKLREFRAWAAGLRRDQSESRAALRKAEQVDGRLKLSPLADWTRQDVQTYIRDHDVPQHPLYARGYTSIGCAPCTRPVEPGEDERAGRWWWEQETAKECGIHLTPSGRVERLSEIGDSLRVFQFPQIPPP